MTWTYPELIERVQAVLPPGLTVQTQLPANQSAWLSVPVFKYAKQLDEPLPTAARDIAKRIEALGDVTVDVSGGFVNITPNEDILVQSLRESSDNNFGSLEVGNGETVVIDLSSPNIAKPMGIGHLRSTIIGDALQRVYRALGYQVISINHLGDWGTQFGKLMTAYEQQFGDLVPRSITIPELLDLYVEFHEEAERDPTLNDAARAMFQRLEAGDVAVRSLWQSFVDLSLVDFQRIYDRLGVVIDEPAVGESFYEKLMPAVIQTAKEQGLAQESDGALVIQIPGETVPLMLQKGDGTTSYATRDLAQIKYRIETYQPQRMLYVVGNEQSLHFTQLIVAARLLEFIPDGVELDHVKFGLIRTAEGKLSTRRGRVIDLEGVLNEAAERALAVLGARETTVDDSRAIAEAVGIAAVKFFDLFHDRNHDIVFDWDRMLNLKGDSAPYLMYSYTRAASILRKSADALSSRPEGEISSEHQKSRDFSAKPRNDSLSLLRPDRQAGVTHYSSLVRTLAKFPLVLEEVVADNSPHHLAQYLNQVAAEFHHFYEQYPVLSSEGDERTTRLAIVQATANVLRRGLDLLGINVLEEM